MSKVLDLEAPNGVKFKLNTGLFINNEFVDSTGGEITSVYPVTGEEIASVQAASEADVDKAVKAAEAAYAEGSEWRLLTGDQRSRLMHKLADLCEENLHTLASLETWDNGKTLKAALAVDVSDTIKVLRYYAGFADKLEGKTIPTHNNKLAYTLRQPVGVCGAIIPWNYPLEMAAWKLGPCLATGNVLVLKPAEQTPLSILYLADLIRQAGFPPGVVNVINGYGKVAGQALTVHPKIRKIAFTGSTLTGREIMKTCGSSMKKLSLETGGKSALIVCEDADIKKTVQWAYTGIMFNQGQTCSATSRLLVHESVKEQFCQELIAFIKANHVVGDPFSEKTSQGPQVSQLQYDKVLNYINEASKQGAKLELGGGSAQEGLSNGKGWFVQPTVFSGVTPDMTIYQEEVFGPVVVVTPFKTDDEAVALANDTEYGLATAVFSEKVSRALKLASRLETGTVWVNSSNDIDYHVPFGGWKQSGIGRELGEAALDLWLHTVSVHVNLSD